MTSKPEKHSERKTAGRGEKKQNNFKDKRNTKKAGQKVANTQFVQ